MDLTTVITMLFTPANRPERFVKAQQSGADGIVIDLEDAIPLSEKDEAREIAIKYFLSSKPLAHFIQCLRINSMKTPAGLKDVSALIDNKVRPDVLVIPKVEYPAEILLLDKLLAPKTIPYIALIETAIGLEHAVAIANVSTNVKVLVFGGGDLAADLGATLTWEPMLNARARIVQAAASAGITAMDVPYLNLRDADDKNIIEECQKVKNLGFTGKFAIHPKHIKPIYDTFIPTPEQAADAKKIVEIYEKANGEVCEVNGKMIDVPVYRSAKRIVALLKN